MGHTMREVAKRAGVSPATVSRVLNKTHYISVETQRRVLEVVGQMKYFKNVHARRLATGRSDLFGLVISEIANPYFPEMIRGFQAAALDRGFDVLLCNTQYDQARTNYHIASGAPPVRALLSSRENPPAISCGSALIAWGPMSALEEAGAGIPEHIPVIGIDDISFASLARPPLTTIRVPRERVGTTAFEALDRMLKLKRRKGADYYLETELVVRGSTTTAR